MNRRMIKKVLKAKHEEWIASIEDETVQKLAKNNSIITGGSIVSLLLGEKVKDYDFYFTDKSTVEQIACYYFDIFKATNQAPSGMEIVVTDDRVMIRIPSQGVASEEGAESFYDEEPREDMPDDEMKGKYRPVFLSDNAITLSNKVQLVIRFFGDPDEIHKNYDFVSCTNYWTSKDNKLTLRPAALESILTKELIYTGSLYPLCSVIRTRKFIKRGWHINAGQYLKMCFQISQLDLTDVEVLHEQLTGVDALYFFEVIDHIRDRQEKDPDFVLTVSYLTEIVDRIFG